jgi:hypothetical protein
MFRLSLWTSLTLLAIELTAPVIAGCEVAGQLVPGQSGWDASRHERARW